MVSYLSFYSCCLNKPLIGRRQLFSLFPTDLDACAFLHSLDIDALQLTTGQASYGVLGNTVSRAKGSQDVES